VVAYRNMVVVMRAPSAEALANRREKVRLLTLDGHTARDIAEIIGVAQRTVEHDRKRVGVHGRATGRLPEPLTAEQREFGRMLLADGCPLAEVARTFGRSVHGMRHYFDGLTQQRGNPFTRRDYVLMDLLDLRMCDARMARNPSS
jgi:DNA-binding CsgD family transcriptional regulator